MKGYDNAMNCERILWVLERIGAENVIPHQRNVSLSCPLAPWSKGHRSNIDRTPSMGIRVNPTGESVVHCFSCDYGGTVQSLVEALHAYGDKDYSDLVHTIVNMEAGDPDGLVKEAESSLFSSEPRCSDMLLEESKIAHTLGRYCPYLRHNRRLDEESIKQWEIGYDAKFRRVTFPVRRHDGSLVGMVGRAISDHNRPRYWNYFSFDKGRYLYGEHLIKESPSIVVSEGIIDAIAIGQVLRNYGALTKYAPVALLGANPTINQLRKLASAADEVVLFLDNDPAGASGQMRLARYLASRVVTRAVAYPNDQDVPKDPGGLINRGDLILQMIDEAPMVIA